MGESFFLRKPQEFHRYILESQKEFENIEILEKKSREMRIRLTVYDKDLISHLRLKLSWDTAWYNFKIEDDFRKWFDKKVKEVIAKMQNELPLDEEFKFASGVRDFNTFRNLEELLCWDIPMDFIRFYQSKNGATNFIESNQRDILSIEQIKATWKRLEEKRQKGEFENKGVAVEAGIDPMYWNRLWLPFARNQDETLLCMDLKPTNAGYFGQVISVSLKNGHQKILANSFIDWK